uniref:Uncharacterized protein n=1 Tax=Arundo donax TaxID=35708 RepID=A0A0A8Y3M3_ARUDO
MHTDIIRSNCMTAQKTTYSCCLFLNLLLHVSQNHGHCGLLCIHTC